MITTETKIGDIVKSVPARARLFENLGIDYCCGGKVSLAEACVSKGLDPATVVAMLSAFDDVSKGDGGPEAEKMTLTEICDHIDEIHHAYLQSELPRLGFLAQKVASVHGMHEPRLAEIQRLFDEFHEDVSEHIRNESEEIFPQIREIEGTGVTAVNLENLLQQLEHEHEETGAALERFKKLTDHYTPPDWACNTFRALYDGLAELERKTHLHVHMENNVLFPKVKALLAA